MNSSHAFLTLLVVSFGAQVALGECPDTPAHPHIDRSTVPEQDRTLDPYSVSQTVRHYYDAPLGIGFLEVVEDGRQHYYDWMFELELPLWQAPDAARPLGWLSDGRIHTAMGIEKLTGTGMVETEYEHSSFIIWKKQEDWIRLRLTKELDAWTHSCHLRSGAIQLDPVPWETFFRRHADWLHFRRPVPHTLRESPDIESERVTTIGLDHKLVLRDIHGDWMKVEVQQPDLTCRGPDADAELPVTNRGWVKWRDEHGPWVFVYTRGC